MCLIQWDGRGTKWWFVLYFVHSTRFYRLADNEVSVSLSTHIDRMRHLKWLMRRDNQNKLPEKMLIETLVVIVKCIKRMYLPSVTYATDSNFINRIATD